MISVYIVTRIFPSELAVLHPSCKKFIESVIHLFFAVSKPCLSWPWNGTLTALLLLCRIAEKMIKLIRVIAEVKMNNASSLYG